jgi:hypothetical protein
LNQGVNDPNLLTWNESLLMVEFDISVETEEEEEEDEC